MTDRDNQVKAQISDNEVVQSGLIISHSGDAILLRPFDDDLDFIVRFEFEFEDGVKPQVDVVFPDDNDKSSIIRFKRPFKAGETFSNSRSLIFAVTDDEASDYLANLVVTVLGTERAYTLMLAYTIVIGGGR